MSVVFGASFHFDIIGEIPAWPHKSCNYGKKPTYIQNWQNWTRDFVKLIVDNHCMPNTSYGALRKPCGRSTSVFCSVESRVAALDFGMSDVVCDR